MNQTTVACSRSFVRAGGHRLRVERLEPAGPRDGPVLVFLHEGLGSIDQWRGFPAELCAAAGLTGLVYERWGFGGSDPLVLPRPRDYLETEARVALPEVLAQCGVERPILVGHSDGGTIALEFAAAFPDRPLACITEAAHVFIEDVTIAGIRAAVAAWESGDLKARLAKYHGAGTEAMFRGWAETWLDPEFRTWAMVETLPSIVCPLLVIQGEADEYGSDAQVDAIVDGVSGPAERLIVPGAAHVPHLQAREMVLAAMARFVERVTSAQRHFGHSERGPSSSFH